MTATGLPILRPLFLEFPNAMLDDAPVDVSAGNQFLVGPSLLVAPPLFPEQPDDYTATLPGDNWFEYWTGTPVAAKLFNKTTGALAVPIHPTLETLPVFVRGGAILPMQPLVQSTSERPDGPLTLRVYPGADCRGSLYLDDGSTFDYLKGGYLRLHFSCEQTATGWKVNVSAREGQYKPWWNAIQITLFGWDWPDAQVSLEGTPLTTGARVDPGHHSITVEIPDSEKGESIAFNAKN